MLKPTADSKLYLSIELESATLEYLFKGENTRKLKGGSDREEGGRGKEREGERSSAIIFYITQSSQYLQYSLFTLL
jgi:hypothetical protein